jgi:hypothetical protein
MTWNDFCWNDWEGVSCGYTAVVIVGLIMRPLAVRYSEQGESDLATRKPRRR